MKYIDFFFFSLFFKQLISPDLVFSKWIQQGRMRHNSQTVFTIFMRTVSKQGGCGLNSGHFPLKWM